MCDFSNKILCTLIGIGVGIMIGYQNEEKIDDLTHSTKRAKKKMMRKMYELKDQLDI